MKHFSATNLMSIRQARGLSRAQVAFAIDRHPDSVRDYEHGRIRPNPEALVRLVEFLECDFSDLYEDSAPVGVPGRGARRTKGSASREVLLGESAAPSSGKSRRRR